MTDLTSYLADLPATYPARLERHVADYYCDGEPTPEVRKLLDDLRADPSDADLIESAEDLIRDDVESDIS
jgi:hypothetical protein